MNPIRNINIKAWYSYHKFLTKFFIYLLKKRLFIESSRLFKYIIFSKLGIVQLHSIFISLSHECNANCEHCYEKFENKNLTDSLTTNEVKGIIDQFHKLGGVIIYFCSGEVTLRPDLAELIAYAHSKKILTSITSNGILLTEEKINELKAAGLTDLVISIDSADPSVHNKLRGTECCFEKAKNALKYAKKVGINTFIWTYITKSHFNELEGIAKLGEELEVEYVFVYFPLLSGKLFNCLEENLSIDEREKLRKHFKKRKVIKFEFSSEKAVCRGGGLFHINIMPSGETTFCPPVPYSYGNIHNRPLRDCLIDIKKDHRKFCATKLTGQCPVNFLEYRENCNAKFIYKNKNNKH